MVHNILRVYSYNKIYTELLWKYHHYVNILRLIWMIMVATVLDKSILDGDYERSTAVGSLEAPPAPLDSAAGAVEQEPAGPQLHRRPPAARRYKYQL